MIRAIAAAAAASVLLAPAVAAASPSPSPSLDTVLAEPPSPDFVPESRFAMAVQGDFDAVDYLAVLNATKPSHTLATLQSDGFVRGYGRSWAGSRSNQLLLEIVIAFSGAAGAKRWLPEARTLDQNSSYFKSSFTIPGVDVQFGNHFVNPSGPAFADSAGFVKANTYFFVYMFSQKDDLADTVQKQARQEYGLAPASTIPPSQWPENSGTGPTSSPLTGIAPVAIFVAVVVVVVVLVGVLVAMILIRGRPKPAPVVAAFQVQMSPDGNYWWDGQAWRDASRGAPPDAQRSPDGHYWWDGTKWRLMPAAN